MRALYLGDNDFEALPSDIGHLKNLQIVSICEPLSALALEKLIMVILCTLKFLKDFSTIYEFPKLHDFNQNLAPI